MATRATITPTTTDAPRCTHPLRNRLLGGRQRVAPLERTDAVLFVGVVATPAATSYVAVDAVRIDAAHRREAPNVASWDAAPRPSRHARVLPVAAGAVVAIAAVCVCAVARVSAQRQRRGPSP
eukprot:scaffold5048_cov338-Prasinococcus_capsulatus_cf.AAC.3